LQHQIAGGSYDFPTDQWAAIYVKHCGACASAPARARTELAPSECLSGSVPKSGQGHYRNCRNVWGCLLLPWKRKLKSAPRPSRFI